MSSFFSFPPHITHTQMAPVLRSIEGRYKDKVNFVVVNGDTTQVRGRRWCVGFMGRRVGKGKGEMGTGGWREEGVGLGGTPPR